LSGEPDKLTITYSGVGREVSTAEIAED